MTVRGATVNVRLVLLLVAAAVAGVGAARADGGPPTGTDGLAPGTVLDPTTAAAAGELLPPEILRHYESGRYRNPIVDWPLGVFRWEPSFKAATDDNRGRYDVDAAGMIVEKAGGKQPPFVYGLPFPSIDPQDRTAAIKILWNYQYHYWSEGNSNNVTALSWVNPGGLDREAVQDVRFLYYDGQDADRRVPNPNNFSQQFVTMALAPADLNGTATLTWRYRDAHKRDAVWVYVPALRRVRAVSPANRSDGFLGSDMSQDDGPFFDGKPEDFVWALAGEADTLRLVDPWSFNGGGPGSQKWLTTGGWRAVWPRMPVAGFQDSQWRGVAWAPLPAGLARRRCWIVEGTPRDRYYLYGRVQLYIDKETYQGAWNRKFSWSGELLNTVQVVVYQKQPFERPDGVKDWIWDSNFSYQAAENLKQNRATVAGLVPRGSEVPNDRRVTFEPGLFESQTLHRLGK
ncbi:outer membrane lipoprotein-sorting protein [Candidatus Binatia bacterium]|nr:outer membrane lipoprotein-sorting protein [Candidatus Binatia bacterium]